MTAVSGDVVGFSDVSMLLLHGKSPGLLPLMLVVIRCRSGHSELSDRTDNTA